MDTLAALAALAALVIQVVSHPRVLTSLGREGNERPMVALAAVAILSLAACVGGLRGYRKDWPRWANGRAAFAVAVGALLLAVSLLDAVLRQA